jgi:hypothetical protein
MLQMTVGTCHEINVSGLEDILKSKVFEEWQQQHPDEKLKMIFIVHPSVYEEFNKQSYLYNYVAAEGNSKDDSKTRPRNTEKRREERKAFIESQVVQYVMTIDLEQRLTIIQQQGRKRQRDDLDSSDREEKRQKK